MNTQERRQAILNELQASDTPLTGDMLSKKFKVSRQIIVTDVSKLRESGETITSTKRGYIIEKHPRGEKYERTIKVNHTFEEMKDEVSIIVENGAVINNVSIIHPIYGRITVDLMLRTVEDCTTFSSQMDSDKGRMLADLTDGLHEHVISAPTEKILDNALADIRAKGYLIE